MRPLFSTTERDPLWRREMRERWRRPVTLFILLSYSVSLGYVAYWLYGTIVPSGAVNLQMELRGIGHRLFIALLNAQILAWIPIAFLLAAPTIAAERERRTLPEYLLAGLQPRQLVRAKFASVATFIIVMCAVPLPVLALCLSLGGVEPLELFAGAFLQVTVALVCAAFGLWISVVSPRVTTAMQRAMVLSGIFLLVTITIVPSALSFWFPVWLLLAVPLIAAAKAMVGYSENSLDFLSHNLEENERALQPALPVIPAPRPPEPPKPKTKVPTPRFEPARRSYLDWCIEKVASRNAVTQREVRVGLRASRSRMSMSSDENIESKLVPLWLSIGFLGTALIALLGFSEWWYLSLKFAALAILVVTGIASSATFTREREQKTLAQLRLCTLSPLEVVGGKIVAILLMVARGWIGPMLALYLIGVTQGLDIAISSSFFIGMCAVFAATMATLFSLFCRHTSIAIAGTLGTFLFSFVFLPLAPQGLAFFFPSLRGFFTASVLDQMWGEPLRVVWGSPSSSLSFAEALFRLSGSLAILTLLLFGGATLLLARQHIEEAHEKIRFWERDLARSWR